ncbi:hypothetical protein [Parabacteroides faecis]|uniref:hypothetical protein n=1 Tax=Parabacteroides faecis TaxID=1217282 RepID=UPI0035214463
MKRVSLLGILLFFCAISFVSCGNDDEEKKEIYPLSFEKEYYEVPLFGKTFISVRGGNKEYMANVEKPNILEVSIDVSSPIGMGNLVIYPKQKGETTVTIKDNITNETVDLKVKVTDGYLAYAIENSNHPALSQGTIVYLINNEAKDCYFFRSTDSGIGGVNAKGTYEFSVKLESGIGNSSPTYAIPYLTLNYASDEQGNFTDAAILPTPHSLRFEMNDGETNDVIINIIQDCLGVDWKALIEGTLKGKTKSVLRLPRLKTTIDDTDYIIIGILNITPAIPENILK